MLEDFNQILQPSKKLGERDRPKNQMFSFREVLEDCELHDLGFSGTQFTWCNNKDGE